MTAGPHEFVWHHTAPHKTTNWRYYITKQNWDPNKPLTRDQFELTPFCTINGNGQAPAMTKSMTCNVPESTGYRVIYGGKLRIPQTVSIRPLTLISVTAATSRRTTPQR